MIGNSTLSVDDESDITTEGKHFKGTTGSWELLTHGNVHTAVITA